MHGQYSWQQYLVKQQQQLCITLFKRGIFPTNIAAALIITGRDTHQ